MHPPYRGRLGQVIFINQQALTDVFGASTFLNLITFTYILILRLSTFERARRGVRFGLNFKQNIED